MYSVEESDVDRPRLRHCTMLDSGADIPLRLIVGKKHFDLTEDIGSRATFLQLKSLMDGRHSIQNMAEQTGLSYKDVTSVISAFRDQGLLRSEAQQGPVPVSEFIERISATTEMWRRQIGFHPLFQGLATGRYRLETLQGLFIETYHLVKHCPKHIGAAIAHCSSDVERLALSRYLSEEYEHSGLLLTTCTNLGCNPDHVSVSHPIVGTVSLIQMLADIGRTDTLAYAAAMGLFEAAPGDDCEGAESIERIARAYNLSEEIFAPAMEHLREDLACEHQAMLVELLAGQDSLPKARVHAIVNLLHDLKHSYDQLHDGILAYYEDISNYIPRLKVDYFSL